MTKSHFMSHFSGKLSRLLFVLFFLAGCIPTQATSSPEPSQPQVSEAAAKLLAEVTFEVDASAKTAAGSSLFIDILDEVTGLALNPSRYRMEDEGGNHFTFKIPVQIGSLIKYRYGMEGASPKIEYSSSGKQIRYRLLQVSGPTTVKDLISGWQDQPFDGEYGRLIGQVVDAITNSPIPNVMVTAGGIQTLTAADGSYLIEGLPAGVHNIVAYSLDGIYKPYQQGAQVSVAMATPAPLRMEPAQLVKVTFVAIAPSDSARGIPLRIIGNILSMGNTFADLGGGVSTIASRAPLMTSMPDGRYNLTLSLPAGLDLRYKYTAGDGFWNAERGENGEVIVRQLIVPDQDIVIDDTITAFQTEGFSPVTFTVTVPENTPVNDTVSIQFNPYGWTQPIPMWPLGNRQWLFVLYNPLHLVPNIGYRFCRNDQCSMADDSTSIGPDSPGKMLTPGKSAQNIQVDIKDWAWIEATVTPTNVDAGEILPREASFLAGVELQPAYRPSWQPYISWGFDNIKHIGSNWVVIDPTWTATRINPPVFETASGQDAYWQDLIQMVVWAQDKGLNIGMFPTLNFDRPVDQWWNAAQNDTSWWQTWFDRYRSFLLHHADLAAQVRAGFLVLGDPQISPALPGGSLPNGKPADLPGDVKQKWQNLIAEVRTHYKGKIAWALPYTPGMETIPEFIGDVDEIYLLWSAKLSDSNTATTQELADQMGQLLDQDISKLKETLQKPVILAIDYASVKSAAQGCAMVGSNCVPFDSLNVETGQTSFVPDLAEQAKLYNAVLIAINDRPWINGLVSRGFYPPATLQDFSSSVNGKPAADMLWYWFSRMVAPKK